MDPISESRLSQVHPELARRIHQLEQYMIAEGIEIRVVQGLRTYAEQDAIYAQGRTTPGKIVTKAPGGYSMHNFGLAVDVAPFRNGQPDWDASDSEWQLLLAKALTCGLAEGARWTHVQEDNPHLYPQELPASPSDTMRSLMASGGLQAVWDDAFHSNRENVQQASLEE
jgi:peptidoglycan L-alanyl-D-glutamate endopeptidase CwlK